MVQGVGFRYAVYRLARSLGLVGFVRNEPDGSVLIEAEGEDTKLNELIEWCHTGPAGAGVEKVDYKFKDELKGFNIFEIEFR